MMAHANNGTQVGLGRIPAANPTYPATFSDSLSESSSVNSEP